LDRCKMQSRGSSSPLPAIGMLAGLLLLGFAGVLVLVPSSVESQQPQQFLPRRLQAFGYITTSRAPSSFDSSDSSSLGSSLEPSKSLESGSLESSDFHYLLPKIVKSLGSGYAKLTGSLLLQCLFACLYYKLVVSSILNEQATLDTIMDKGGPPGGSDFSPGICECHKDKWVCCSGFCCPMVRLAHTNAVSGVCPFWESLMCWCCCSFMTFNIGPFCLLMWWRLRLKTIMRIEDNPINDFCVTMFCPNISICQMSSAVDSAMGYQMTTPIHYLPYRSGGGLDQLVG